ncbi:MAG: hypothetical protein C7B45_08910 [Sulfobacillus acidophilus]|uniref:DUF302 domain-containing protein n=1 Tax=Sulfobacillus acidophilus TaxID=53633 RepID=A0A2T2WI36_9FIRM|nr:MAG: hypothetical protein C7B45_08910 [Sulfobacillus acidophilus]
MAQIIYQVQTKQTVDEAVHAIAETLQRHQFGVLWDLDINQKLVEKGLDAEPPYRILEVCSAPRAKQVLSRNPQAGNFLPCKIVVYQEAQTRQTIISFANPVALIGLIDDHRLDALAKEVGELLKQAVDEAAAFA